jgi:hypothetical protein
MQRTLLTLLAALALLLVAAGGVAAVDSGTAIGDDHSDNTTDDDADVGVCVVGADSPCNDAPEKRSEQAGDGESDRIGDGETDHVGSNNGSTETSRIWLPEDQNRDGMIDDRFRGANVPHPLAFALQLFRAF